MTLEELKSKMKKFEDAHVIFLAGKGYLIWRYDTGNTVQICDIEVYKKRQGIGRHLLWMMIQEFKDEDVNGIYGFTAEKNKVAQKFYKAVGFTLSDMIDNLYKRGAYLFTISYKEAKKIWKNLENI